MVVFILIVSFNIFIMPMTKWKCSITSKSSQHKQKHSHALARTRNVSQFIHKNIDGMSEWMNGERERETAQQNGKFDI